MVELVRYLFRGSYEDEDIEVCMEIAGILYETVRLDEAFNIVEMIMDNADSEEAVSWGYNIIGAIHHSKGEYYNILL